MELGAPNMRKHMKTIVVHDVPADRGGALAILKQFLEEIKTNEIARNYHWIIFVSNSLVDEFVDNHIEIVKVNVRKWHRRIWWDTLGIKRWIRRNLVDPVIAISLASVGFRCLDIPQLVYIHQSLPYGDFKDFKWFEWKARFYTWGIGKWMKWSIKRDSTIVVQTNWMKEVVSRKLGIFKNHIHIIRPRIEPLVHANVKYQNCQTYRLFYPAAASVSYKNHELLIRMLLVMKETEKILYSRVEVVFTCKPEDRKLTRYYFSLARKLGVNEKIDWKGYLNKDDVVREYIESDIVLFPSKLETFGLPLMEAAFLGKPILVLDKPYAHDVLEGYDGVRYLEDEPSKWVQEVKGLYTSGTLKYESFGYGDSDVWASFVGLCCVDKMLDE